MKLFRVVAFVSLALLATPLAATTFVMVSDEDLTDQASAVVEARVLSVDRAPGGGMPATDYLIEIDRVLKGSVPGSNLILRSPGGVAADGMSLRIAGAPRFAEGERALLFLAPGADGTFYALDLMLGAFHRVSAGGREVYVRDLAEARELPSPGGSLAGAARYRQPRNPDRFTAWIADRAAGTRRGEDYFAPPPAGGLTTATGAYAFFHSMAGHRLRWFEFDDDAHVDWRVHVAGQDGLTFNETVAAFRTGQAAWVDDPATNIDYRYGGTTTATGGLVNFDGINALLFGDPNGEVSGTFNCLTGGVLAYGGPWYDNDITMPRNGEIFTPIAGADVVTNNNIGCFFTGNPNRIAAAEELFGHELGHTLGLDHSCIDESLPCDPEALMSTFIHNDGRGAQLTDDDRAAIFELYGIAAAPAAPSDLVATPASATSIALSWSDNSSNETGFAIESRTPLHEYQQIALAGTSATGFTVTGLTPGEPATFRVKAANLAGDSEYSNEASATPDDGLPSSCSSADDTLCLLDDRFRVRVQWRNQHLAGDHGEGSAAEFSGSMKSGTFWFFNPANVELIVKALDATTVNGRFWIFYGALSDVEYWITVTDTATGGSKTYHNPPGNICGEPDTDAFPSELPPGATGGASILAAAPEPAGARAVTSSAGTAPCVADAETLCLADGRFELRVSWHDQHNGGDGVGTAVPGTEKTGYFWFFNAQNIELVVKVLDARSLPGNAFWFFYGALSDVEYTITVRDTVTGLVKPYTNEPGNFCGQGDTGGFPDSL